MRLLRLVLAAFLFLGTVAAVGQEIKLNVLSFNPCNSTYENELLVTLFKDNKPFQISDTLGTILLPEIGEYKLKTYLNNEFYRLTDSVKLIKIHPGQNYDTLTRTTILKCYIVVADASGDCGYFCCDKECEGYKVDYFDNGKKKLEGNFKKGFPLDS